MEALEAVEFSDRAVTVGADRVVAHPAAEVWALLSDLRRHWPLLGADLVEAGIVDGSEEESAELLLRGPFPGIERRVVTRVTYADPARSFGGIAVAGRTRASIDWELHQADDAATRVSFSATIEPGGRRDRFLVAPRGAAATRRRAGGRRVSADAATASGGAKHRAQALDLIRAFAAMAVLTYHVWLYRLPDPDHPTRSHFLDHVFFEFRIGLVVFFVLSGYLLYRPLVAHHRAAPSRLDARRYYWRRIVRIVPAYYLAILGSIALLWSIGDTPGVRLPPADMLWTFPLFLQNYFSSTLLTLDAPTWTLVVQVAFYLVFPLFVWFGMRAGRRAWLVPLALILFGAGFNWVSYHNGWGPIARLSLFAMLPYLALGMLIAHLPPARTRRAAVWMIAAGLALAFSNSLWHALGGWPWGQGVLRDVPGAVGYALIIAACAQPVIGASGKLRWAEAFGRWSYGVFLWHLPLLLFIKGHGLMPSSWFLTWLMLVTVASAAGATTWRFVERPLLMRSRGAS